jgi:hypothetical protein
MPVAIVARQPRGVQCEHRADGPFTHRREQPAEARTRLLARAAHAEIVVDHDDARKPPVARAIGEPVLPLLAFAVMTHLLQTRLTHIDVRGSLQVVGPNFLVHPRSLLLPQREVPHRRRSDAGSLCHRSWFRERPRSLSVMPQRSIR